MTSYSRKHKIFGVDKNSVGDVKYSVREDDHIGWLKCDGRSLDTTIYSSLFAVIGYSFGGSGNSFNLPDPAGRVLGVTGGEDTSGITTRTTGDLSGSETHILTIDEMAEHTHIIDSNGQHSHTVTDPGHTHDISLNTTDDRNFSAVNNQQPVGNTLSTNLSTTKTESINLSLQSNGSHIHIAQNTGSSEPFNLIQPTIFIANTFIYSGLRYIGSRSHLNQPEH